MTQDTKTTPTKNISIIIRNAQEKKHKCILCDPDEIETQEQKYYNIEIYTSRRTEAKAIILSLASTKKGFEGEYNRLTRINMILCKFHYRNISENLPINQEMMVDFDEFKKLFKTEQLEIVQ